MIVLFLVGIGWMWREGARAFLWGVEVFIFGKIARLELVSVFLF